MNTSEGVWLSINEYSRYKDISISTTRRHIKNNIIRYKEENGKYFILINSIEKLKFREEEELMKRNFEIEELKFKLRKLEEENNELKMLVAIYENKNELPPEFLKTI
jgi:hypothetical protein